MKILLKGHKRPFLFDSHKLQKEENHSEKSMKTKNYDFSESEIYPLKK